MRKIFVLLVILFTVNAYSQYNQQWVNRLNGSSNSFDIANNMLLDEQSNVYVYSTMSNLNNLTDISAVKYSPSGSILWQYVYSSPGIDQLQDVYKDAANNSYLTGYTQNSGQIKLLTIKLSSMGGEVWTKVSSVSNHENLISRSITLDNTGNAFVLLDGKNSITDRTDFIIAKYNQSGNIVAQRIIESDSGQFFNSIKIVCDLNGNIFAGINGHYNHFGFDIAIYKLLNDLNTVSIKRIAAQGSVDDGVVEMKISYDNNLLITAKISGIGTSSDIGTFKINNTNGDILWQKFYNGEGNSIDLPYSMEIDNFNNILVTGYARNSVSIGSEDIVTLKYDANGNLLWSRVYNDSVNGTDQGYSVCADAQGNVYVGGAADNGSGHLEYIALKYDSQGNLLWKGNYHYYHLSEDFIYKIAVNSAQDIFVSGISFSNTTDYDVATVKYARQTGIYSNSEIINNFILYTNYPNPFNPSTKIRFYNPQRNFITVKVFDLRGTEIAILENKNLNAGNYEYEFKPENLSSGVYLYQVYYGENFKTGKLIFSK